MLGVVDNGERPVLRLQVVKARPTFEAWKLVSLYFSLPVSLPMRSANHAVHSAAVSLRTMR